MDVKLVYGRNMPVHKCGGGVPSTAAEVTCLASKVGANDTGRLWYIVTEYLREVQVV